MPDKPRPNENYWDAQTPPPRGARGCYIAISGNTGAGKSTLVSGLSATLGAEHAVVGLNERLFHHPLLPLMFADPHNYSFPVQLNFMLQRHLCCHRLLALGTTVIVERSHFDDRLYMELHREVGHVSPAEFDAYQQLHSLLSAKLREPDIWVLMEISPDDSFRRVTAAEAAGERPCEFPNDTVKRFYIDAWHRSYSLFFERVHRDKAAGERFGRTAIISVSGAEDHREVMEAVRSRYAQWLSLEGKNDA